ncbi:ABC transporter ATP-binding protein [Phaeocystidibacter marisrubri]|uniref:ABC transporter ATP-binding protein n=1 Tax=Phaeocystidibacter marisrubri TaxID=1577780 RepID=A0A6L3ZGH6_9FLAO|nr:ABC transporter ATP-binding protein [Phaeocystidibacter marisrubri]KAB2817136.1 ABC transporter ATP-binding protein [Phaeocystidibacter marisrubri]GGH76710.1 multidrug ABC transporter ATP-binding protein [Phaeocystidibacter marisrubri]
MQKDEKKAKRLSKDSIRQIFKLYEYIRPFRGVFALGMVFLILSSLANLAFPMLMGELILPPPNATEGEVVNNLLPQSGGSINIDAINKTALQLIALLLAQALFSYGRVRTFVYVTENALARLRQVTYEHLIKLPIQFFNQRRVGELNSRISSDITQLQETMTTTLAEFVRQLIIIIGGVTLMVITSWKLALFTLAILPPMVLLAVFFGRFIRKYSKQFQAEVAESNTIVEESLQGIYNVKAFANEFLEITRYRKKTSEVAQTGIKGGSYRAAFSSFMVVGMFGAIVAIIWKAATLIEQGHLEHGDLVSFILLAGFVGGSIAGFADVYARVQKAVGATEELMKILDEETEDLDYHPSPIPGFKGDVAFINVTFAYPTRPDTDVVRNLSFTANSGDQIALVGPSGAGKSTLVQLIMRFFEPSNGEIQFDGKPANQYNLSVLRNHMAVVPQDVFLFGGTIRENIAYGKSEATEEEIIEAAKKANAWKFISEFSSGLETIVGERGVQLSGGQRQRIAIARAVLKDPAILILDEATSALDSESERLVQEALDKLMVGRTTIVIAHRLSTVRSADKILVMENGQIIESGNHYELSENKEGLYYQLSSMQFAN